MSVPLRFDQLDPVRQSGITANIAKMRAAGAPDSDVESYLAKHEHLAPVQDAARAEATPHGSSGTWGDGNTSGGRGVIAAVLNGATAGMLPKVVANFAAATSPLHNALRVAQGAPKQSQDDVYNQTLAQQRGTISHFHHDHPIAAPALEVAGGLGTGLVIRGAQAASAVPSFLRSVATGSAAGAGIGAASAAGQNDGDMTTTAGLLQRLDAAKSGAIWGGMAGAASPFVAKGIEAVGTPLIRTGADALGRVAPSTVIGQAAAKLARNLSPVALEAPPTNVIRASGSTAAAGGINPSLAAGDATAANPTRAGQKFVTAIERSGITPEQAIQQLRAAPADMPLTPMDIFGRPMARLTRNSAVVPSQGSTQITNALRNRDEAELSSVIDALQTGTGLTRQNQFQTAKALAETRQAKAQPNFDRAFSNNGALPPELYNGMLKLPFFDKAWAQAQRLAELDGVTLPQIKTTKVENLPGPANPSPDLYDDSQWAQILKKAGVNGATKEVTTSETVPNLQAAHYVKLGLDDVVNDKLRAPLDRGGISNTMGVKVLKRLNEWTDGLKAHSPDYANALNDYAGDSRMMEAQAKGLKLLSMHPDEITATMADMGAGEREQFRASGMSAIRDYLDNIPETASPSRALTKNKFVKDRIATLFPTAEDAAQFNNALGNWKSVRANNRFVDGGSNTTDKALDAADSAGPDFGNAAVTALTGGGIHGAAKAIVRSMLKSGIAQRAMGVNEATTNSLAPMLTAGSGMPGAMSRDELIEMLQALSQRYAQRGPFPTYQPALSTGITTAVGESAGRRQP